MQALEFPCQAQNMNYSSKFFVNNHLHQPGMFPE